MSENPLEPRNSALPGAVFWNGSAPLWMFEKIYCTQESLENESFAAQEIGWATSQIFVQMAAGLQGEGPILETVDWKELNPSTRDEVTRVHKELRKLDVEEKIWRCIDDANDAELEHFKQALLRPIAASKRCVIAGSMSGLRHWLEPVSAQSETSQTADHVRDLLSMIEQPVHNSRSRNGVQLLSPPGSWDKVAVAQQNSVRDRVETPDIRDLQAGIGDFAGERGFTPFINRAAEQRAAYETIDAPLMKEWERNLPSLLRLREVASKHLWPQLHGDWIPALMRQEPEAIKDYPRYVSSSLRSQPFRSLLNVNTRQILGVISAGAAAIAISEPSFAEVAAYVGIGAGLLGLTKDRQMAPKAGPLAVFYQEASRTLQNDRTA